MRNKSSHHVFLCILLLHLFISFYVPLHFRNVSKWRILLPRFMNPNDSPRGPLPAFFRRVSLGVHPLIGRLLVYSLIQGWARYPRNYRFFRWFSTPDVSPPAVLVSPLIVGDPLLSSPLPLSFTVKYQAGLSPRRDPSRDQTKTFPLFFCFTFRSGCPVLLFHASDVPFSFTPLPRFCRRN